VAADPVDRGVVGEDACDRDVVAGEPGCRPEQESLTGGVTFVGPGFHVGQAGLVIDGHAQEVIADAAPVDRVSTDVVAAGVPSPPTAVGDLAEPCDIDVDQVAGSGVFVAAL
jgi:hypothetical protein